MYTYFCTRVGVQFPPHNSGGTDEVTSRFFLKSSCTSKIEWNKKTKEGFRDPWCKETGPVLIAASPLPSFLSALVLERRAMFAALIAGERIVLPEETSKIKPTALHRTVQGFGWGKLFCTVSSLCDMVKK